jgi:hypothetical protein
MNTPTQINVFTEKLNVWREPANFSEQICADEQTSRVESKYVAHRIMLFLILFARICDRADLTYSIHSQPNALHNRWVVPHHQLWADHPSVGAKHFLHQPAHCVGFEGDIVVHQTKESAFALNEPAHFVH